jgi:hypothetical protein
MEYPDYIMLFLFLVTSFMLVSIHDVFNNMPKNDLPAAFSFFLYALLGTSWIIQALIVGFFIRVVIPVVKVVYKKLDFSRIASKLRY